MNATGTFEVQMQGEPPFDEIEGVSLGRARFDKTFSGELQASGVVHMLSARTPVASSAGYVALERVTGTLGGRRGTFVLQHNATMKRGTPSLAIAVVPDSGTGELLGLSGSMTILIEQGKHSYTFEYALE